jgi:hypothetical protein
MALLRGINQKAKNSFRNKCDGAIWPFSSIEWYSQYRKARMHLLHRIIWYHAMIIPAWNLSYYFVFFMGIIFASLYYGIVSNIWTELQVLTVNGSNSDRPILLYHCWLWTHQTGFLTLSSAEALIGLLSFAAAGLFFGRFSRPIAFFEIFA